MKKILIVDDSLFMRMVLKNIFSKESFAPEKNRSNSSKKALAKRYKILEASSDSEAMEQYNKEKPDLVFLDIIMPGGEEEGIKILKKMIKTDSKAKIVMISAVGQDAIIEECKKYGAKDYIVKPFDEARVAKTARNFLQ